MSPRPKVLKFLGLLLVACLAFGVTAGSASAQRHYSAKQKKAISHKLLKQLKKNPKLMRSKSFIRKASAVNFQLPVTIRLNPDIVLPNVLCQALFGAGHGGCASPVDHQLPIPGVNAFGLQNSDDVALLDLGQSLGGVKSLKLGGYVEAYVDFLSPLDGGNLGDVEIVFKNSTGAPSLEANPVSVLTNPDVTTKTVANGGCTDRDVPSALDSNYFGGAFSFMNEGGPAGGSNNTLKYTGAGDVDRPSNTPFMNTDDTTRQNTVLRASGAVSVTNPTGNLKIGINAAKSGGFANLLGAGPSQVKLALDLNLWTVIRGVDAQRGNSTNYASYGGFSSGGNNGYLDPFDTNCRQAWGGYTHNLLRAVTGGDKNSLRIAPAFTLDRHLRIAKINFGSTGVTTHNTVRACLQPFDTYAQEGLPVQLFNWDKGTAADDTDNLVFPKPDRIRGQLGNTSVVQPAPSGTPGQCDNYPTDDPAMFPNVTGIGSQAITSTVLLGGPGLTTVPANTAGPSTPWFRQYPYNFHRLPGIEAATCSYDTDGLPTGGAVGTGNNNTGPGAICTETGIQNSAIIDADVTVQNLTAEVLVGQGFEAPSVGNPLAPIQP